MALTLAKSNLSTSNGICAFKGSKIIFDNALIQLVSRMLYGDTYASMTLDQLRFIRHYIAAMKDIDLSSSTDIYGDILEEYRLFDKFLGSS